jgi:hypothetical protein
MEEVIRKSKAYKAQKALQKEADLAQLEQLDDSFRLLVQGGGSGGGGQGGAGALAALLKPPGYDK